MVAITNIFTKLYILLSLLFTNNNKYIIVVPYTGHHGPDKVPGKTNFDLNIRENNISINHEQIDTK